MDNNSVMESQFQPPKPLSTTEWACKQQGVNSGQTVITSEQTINKALATHQMSTTCRLALGNKVQEGKMKDKRVGWCKPNSRIKDIGDGSNEDGEMPYLTQHHIDTDRQSRGMCLEVLYDDCIPCCDSEARRERSSGADIGLWLTWSLIRSEVAIYILHMTSIILGAVKEGFELRHETPHLALVVTCVETAATLVLVLVRMTNAYSGYKATRSTVRHDEHFDPDKDLHVQQLRRWMIVFEVNGAVLFAGPLISFICCHFYAHVGWTVLSNNISMISILVLSALYTARVTKTVSRIREDQYKVVIYEAATFIEREHEAMKKILPAENYNQVFESGDSSKAMVFVRALRSTKLLEQPGYIELVNQKAM